MLTYKSTSTYKFKRAFFSTRPSDRAQIWHACVDRDETGSHQKKLTNPTPEGFRGYSALHYTKIGDAGGVPLQPV